MRAVLPLKATAVSVTVLAAVWSSSAAVGRGAASPLLALTGGGLGQQSRLVALNQRTLRASAPGSVLPGWAFGYEWSRWPGNGQVAVLPRPSDSANWIYVVNANNGRTQRRIAPHRGAVCALDWAAPRRLLVLVAEPQCDVPVDDVALLALDPATGRTLASHTLAGGNDASRPLGRILAITTTAGGGGRVAILLGTPSARAPVRLVLATTNGSRSVPLPGIRAPAEPRGNPVVVGLALAIDPHAEQAVVVDSTGVVITIALRTGSSRMHRLLFLEQPRSDREAQNVEARFLSPHRLVITGDREPMQSRLSWPLGLRLIDTRTWLSRLLNPKTTAALISDNTLLAYGGRNGVFGYDTDGMLRFHVLGHLSVSTMCVAGADAYAIQPAPATQVIRLETGQTQAAPLSLPTAGLIASCQSADRT